MDVPNFIWYIGSLLGAVYIVLILFEYSVYGSPNQKIGDFTKQAKLTGWSA